MRTTIVASAAAPSPASREPPARSMVDTRALTSSRHPGSDAGVGGWGAGVLPDVVERSRINPPDGCRNSAWSRRSRPGLSDDGRSTQLRRGSALPVVLLIMRPGIGLTSSAPRPVVVPDDVVAQDSEAFDLDLDLVAGLQQPRRGPGVAHARGRAGREEVAGAQRHRP